MDTLIQPQRDIGPTFIHGLTAASVRDAPLFADVVGDVAVRLDGACLVAHNLPFDTRMLTNEFQRAGTDLVIQTGIDTLAATRCRLSRACDTHGITLTSTHTALADATAVARLLLRFPTPPVSAVPAR